MNSMSPKLKTTRLLKSHSCKIKVADKLSVSKSYHYIFGIYRPFVFLIFTGETWLLFKCIETLWTNNFQEI